MTAFTRTWDAAYEAAPADTDQAKLYAQNMRQLRTDIRERTEVDHTWDGTTADGTHKKLNLIDQAGDPTPNTVGDAVLYAKNDGTQDELFIKDGNADVHQLTKGGGPVLLQGTLASNNIAGDILMDNAIQIGGEDTGAVSRLMMEVTAADLLQIGSTGIPVTISTSADVTITDGSDSMTALSHEARHGSALGADGIYGLINLIQHKTGAATVLVDGSTAIGTLTTLIDYDTAAEGNALASRTGTSHFFIIGIFHQNEGDPPGGANNYDLEIFDTVAAAVVGTPRRWIDQDATSLVNRSMIVIVHATAITAVDRIFRLRAKDQDAAGGDTTVRSPEIFVIDLGREGL